MQSIPLTQGQFAIVDDEDYEELSGVKWYAQWNPHTKSYYAKRMFRVPGGMMMEFMHRRILGLKRGDGRLTDHLNHQTLDNRRENIRIVTSRQNSHNLRCKGYSWHKGHQKYEARIMADGVRRNLGLYDTPREARAAYLAAKRIYHPLAPVCSEDLPDGCEDYLEIE